jgi:hypothetical protein
MIAWKQFFKSRDRLTTRFWKSHVVQEWSGPPSSVGRLSPFISATSGTKDVPHCQRASRRSLPSTEVVRNDDDRTIARSNRRYAGKECRHLYLRALAVPSAFAPRSLFVCAWYGYRAAGKGGPIDAMHWLRLGGRFGTERAHRSGLHRFRCCACGKQFNERSAGSLISMTRPSASSGSIARRTSSPAFLSPTVPVTPTPKSTGCSRSRRWRSIPKGGASCSTTFRSWWWRMYPPWIS